MLPFSTVKDSVVASSIPRRSARQWSISATVTAPPSARSMLSLSRGNSHYDNSDYNARLGLLLFQVRGLFLIMCLYVFILQSLSRSNKWCIIFFEWNEALKFHSGKTENRTWKGKEAMLVVFPFKIHLVGVHDGHLVRLAWGSEAKGIAETQIDSARQGVQGWGVVVAYWKKNDVDASLAFLACLAFVGLTIALAFSSMSKCQAKSLQPSCQPGLQASLAEEVQPPRPPLRRLSQSSAKTSPRHCDHTKYPASPSIMHCSANLLKPLVL